jgi:hypothetical protein
MERKSWGNDFDSVSSDQHLAPELTAYVTVIVAYHRQELPALALPFLFLIVLLNPVTPFVAANGWPLSQNRKCERFWILPATDIRYLPHPA